MTTFGSKLCTLVIGWLVVLAAAAPDGGRVSFLDDDAVRAQAGSSARERWESLSPAKRARMQQRFERLKGMQAEERAELEQRAKKLRSIERDIVASLSAADRERLMRQPPEKRSQLLSELVEAEVRSRGQRIEAKLPSEIRERLRNAPPEQRRAGLETFKQETRERTSVAAVEQIAKALGFGEREIARLQLLPVEQRMSKVLELQKRLSKEQIEKAGLPHGLTAERWKELDALPPREYFAQIMNLRSEDALGDALEGRAQGKRGTKEQREIGRDLARQLKADPKERLELSELSPKERRNELDRRRRARAMRVVRERELLNERQIGILEAMSNEEFFRNARRLSQEIRRGNEPRVGREGGGKGGRDGATPKRRKAGGAGGEAPPRRGDGRGPR